MASIKSFETFISEMDRTEEIETKLKTVAEPENKDVTEVEADAEEVQEVQEAEDKVTPIQGKGDGINPTIPVSEMLEKCYEAAMSEAKAWDEDAHDDHTVETYMAENAALVAKMAVNTLTELQGDMKTEAFEACLNKMTEAYCKKINECKETKDAIDAEDI
jgi:hypothetical protein